MASSSTRSTTAASPAPPEPGVVRRAGRGQVLSYGTGRLCEEPSCGTVLSRYNQHPVCAVHLDPDD